MQNMLEVLGENILALHIGKSNFTDYGTATAQLTIRLFIIVIKL